MSIANLADIERAERELPYEPSRLPESTYELFRRGAEQWGDKPALTFFVDAERYTDAETYSYQQLFGKVTQVANALTSLGVGSEDVVSLLMPNLPETHFAIWGAEAAGIVNPINPLLEPDQIAALMNAVGSKVLVTAGPFPGLDIWGKVERLRHEVPTLQAILVVDPASHVSGVEALAVEKLNPGPQRLLNFVAAMEAQPADRLVKPRRFDREDIASYFLTGGTTGLPKIAMRRHRNELANPEQARILGLVTEGSVGFCGLPLFHVNAVIVTGLMFWACGGHVILATPGGYRSPGVIQNFWKIVSQYRVRLFSAVPTIYAELLNQPMDGYDLSSLEFGICGAAPMSVALFEQFQQKTNVRIVEGYGLTEGCCMSTANPVHGESRVGSIGMRVPWQEMQAAILDDQGRYLRACAVDEPGALLISGPNVFAGYLEAAQNKGAWVDCGDGRQWFNTGDLGRQDADGYFWLTGRKKELIIRGGHNIDPKAIEEPLARHPAVALVAAVGRPDARVGELPVAYVQLKAGAEATEEELLAFAAEHIGERAAVPKRIYLIDQLPLSAVGKIFKPALQHLEIQRVVEETLDGSARVRVEADPKLGNVVTLSGIDEAEAGRLLGSFTFHWRIDTSAPSQP